MVRENIAMIVEEINRPLNVAIAHMMRATCEVGIALTLIALGTVGGVFSVYSELFASS